MSRNKRAPKELAKYIIVQTEKGPGVRQTFIYCSSQKEAKAKASKLPGKKLLFRVDYDFYGEV
jgi:hypothetical protein